MALVPSFADTSAQIFVKQGVLGNADGTSWFDAFANLQDAIDVATPGDEIWVAAGTYQPSGTSPDSSHFLTMTAIELYGGFAGNETDLSQRDWSANLTVIDGDLNNNDTPGDFNNNREDNAHHVFIVDARQGVSVIDGFIFQGGRTNTDAFNPNDSDTLYHRWRGGNLYLRNTDAVVRNCKFRDNFGHQGVSLFAVGTERDTIKVVECEFEFNAITTVGGGSCYFAGIGSVTVLGSAFRDHTSQGFGALTIGNTNAVIRNCEFRMNHAGNVGGAVMLFQNAGYDLQNPTIRIVNCDFVDNSSVSNGAAINFNNFSYGYAIEIDSCRFEGNQISGSGLGGAICARSLTQQDSVIDGISLEITNSDFVQNIANRGGAVYFSDSYDDAKVVVRNCSFYGNEAYSDAGALYFTKEQFAKLDISLKHVTLDSNSAGFGGGGMIFRGGSEEYPLVFDIDSCLFTKNYSGIRGAGFSVVYSDFNDEAEGHVKNTQFLNNVSARGGGAAYFFGKSLLFEDVEFIGNESHHSTFGGGALYLLRGDMTMSRCIFMDNTSVTNGSAFYVAEDARLVVENTLLENNQSNNANELNPAIVNNFDLSLRNVTMVNNDGGIALGIGSSTTVQNCVFDNVASNLTSVADSAVVMSMGGNISSDSTLVAYLMGYQSYPDRHSLEPMLDVDFRPAPGSPCIDAGNPSGITAMYDLAGEPRFFGHEDRIDIGCYESKVIVRTEDVRWASSELSTWPNPADKTLNLQIDEDWIGEMSLTLYDALGRQVYHREIGKSGQVERFTIATHSITQGQYYLIVKTNKYYGSKVLIQHP